MKKEEMNPERADFARQYASMVARLIERLRLSTDNPFAEFENITLVDCRLHFDIFDEPHILLVERN